MFFKVVKHQETRQMNHSPHAYDIEEVIEIICEILSINEKVVEVLTKVQGVLEVVNGPLRGSQVLQEVF